MKYKILMAFAVIALMLIPVSCHHNDSIPPSNETSNETWVTPSEDELLGKYENSDLLFRKTVREKWIAYSYWRMIDNASVELDHKVYMFDRDTEELIEKDIHWRNDLPAHLPPIISEEEAMVIGGGTKAALVYIDPNSTAFATVKPTPQNPCWAVAIYNDKGWNVDVVVVDAVTGEILGHGVPAP